MPETEIQITKSTGEKAVFSLEKLRTSLRRSGAGDTLVSSIIERIGNELYPGISTHELYNRAYALLRKEKGVFASKYKLKKALYELGPTGFPFERYVAQILHHSGYSTKVGEIIKGHCVSHEVDVLAVKGGKAIVVECKFHSESSKKCNVQVPLYIHSRYQDIKLRWDKNGHDLPLKKGWVVTNTQFTLDAIAYGRCAGLYLLSWDFPLNNGLKDRIDRLGLYPLTVSGLLTAKEKEYLLGRDVVLLKQIYQNKFMLDQMGTSEERKKRILREAKTLCNL
jgi:hypothetical protein